MGRNAHQEGPWVRWYVEEMEKLVCEPWMTLTAWRVFVCLLSGLRVDNSTTVTQRMIHDLTGLAQPNIAQALGVLQREGILDQARRGGRYYLSVRHCYRGDRAQLPYVRQQERSRRAKARKEQARA